MRVSLILLAKAVDVNVVRLELNLAETSNIRNIVSGSSMTGVIEATGFKISLLLCLRYKVARG